jgi:YkoY family integral membrane protein
MFEQTFSLSDIPRLFFIIFIEILLSADNAVVLGVISRSLPATLRSRALTIGLISSVVFRLLAILTVATLLKYKWIEIIGAIYLFYLSLRYFTKKKQQINPLQSHSFWKTVFLIECTDLIFAIDSIIASLAFINSSREKIWIVYVGGLIGLVGMRYAARLFSSLLDQFPRLEMSAYLVIGWVGLKLGLSSTSIPIPSFLFWLISTLFFLLGVIQRKR